eukprot:s106_g20.t1
MKSTENLSLNVQLDADLLDLQHYGYSLVPGSCDDAVDFSRLGNSSLTPVPAWRHQLEGEEDEEAKEAEFDAGVTATPLGRSGLHLQRICREEEEAKEAEFDVGVTATHRNSSWVEVDCTCNGFAAGPGRAVSAEYCEGHAGPGACV